MKGYLLIILSSFITGCFYSHTQYRPSTEANDAHRQRETLYIKKPDYKLSISTHINDDYFLVQASAENSRTSVYTDIEDVVLKDPEKNITYKPTSYRYWVHNNGITTTEEKDISKSVIAIKFPPAAIESEVLTLYISFNNQSGEFIKLTKESVILPMTIN